MKVALWLTCGLACTLWPVLAGAQTNYIPLQSFGTSNLSGANPCTELLEGSDGALYGAASSVFKLNKDGSAQTMHVFGALPADGGTPMAGLVELSDGALYGTTAYGGAVVGLGFGTVFKLKKDGSGYQVLHRFGIEANDGKYVAGGLAAIGQVLYGTTQDGGTFARGTVFKLKSDGSDYMIVHHFQDLAAPRQDLVAGSDGALYGTSFYGSNSVAGAIFKINPDGSGYKILRNFAETGGDASAPWGLLEGSDGVLYGCSKYGGTDGNGTVFRIARDGSEYKILHSFIDDGADGIMPNTLCEGMDGALYGTTPQGGRYVGGTAFKMSKDGSGYTTLRHFRNGSEGGWHPAAGLVQGSDGAFYGTTYYSVGDGLGPGVVFALSLQPRSWLTAWPRGEGGITSLTARGSADVAFRLQAGTNLSALGWMDIATNLADALGTLTFTNLSAGASPSFYRLVTP